MMNITDEEMDIIATYMNDEIREELHSIMAPCTREEFLNAYVDRAYDEDKTFFEILKSEFYDIWESI